MFLVWIIKLKILSMTIKNSNQNLKNFDFFWDRIIVPTFNNCLNDADQKFNITNNNFLESKKIYYSIYIKNRESFKNDFHINCEKAKLSLFKIAATICKTFIDKKVFTFPLNQEILNNSINYDKNYFINNYLINYKFAFYCGAGVAFMYLLYFSKDDDFVFKNFLKKGNFNFDHNNDCIDSCEDYIIKNLARNDLQSNPLDVIYLSVIYRLYCENFISAACESKTKM